MDEKQNLENLRSEFQKQNMKLKTLLNVSYTTNDIITEYEEKLIDSWNEYKNVFYQSKLEESKRENLFNHFLIYSLLVCVGLNMACLVGIITFSIPISAVIGVLTMITGKRICSKKLNSISEIGSARDIRPLKEDFHNLEKTLCKAQEYKLSNSKQDIIDVEYTTIKEEIVSESTKEKDLNHFFKEFDKYNNKSKNNCNHRYQKIKVLRK